jgi:hypothetical protein
MMLWIKVTTPTISHQASFWLFENTFGCTIREHFFQRITAFRSTYCRPISRTGHLPGIMSSFDMPVTAGPYARHLEMAIANSNAQRSGPDSCFRHQHSTEILKQHPFPHNCWRSPLFFVSCGAPLFKTKIWTRTSKILSVYAKSQYRISSCNCSKFHVLRLLDCCSFESHSKSNPSAPEHST